MTAIYKWVVAKLSSLIAGLLSGVLKFLLSALKALLELLGVPETGLRPRYFPTIRLTGDNIFV